MQLRLWRVLHAVTFSAYVAAAALAEPLATFELNEVLGVDWTQTLLTYQVGFQPGEVSPDEVRLTGVEGKERPCQFWRMQHHPDGSLKSARLSFFARLEPNDHYRYELIAGTPAASPDAPVVERNEDFLQLDNGKVAVRLLPEGNHQYDQPLPLDAVPGPFAGVRLLDGRWTGGSYFIGDDLPGVTEVDCRVVEQGTLFAEAAVRYTFDNGGFYQLTARLHAGDAVVRIDEQSDSVELGDMWRWRVVFNLASDAWRPDAAYDLGAGHRPSYLRRLAPERMSSARVDTALAAHGFDDAFRSHIANAWLAYDKPQTKIAELHAWYNYGNAYYIGFVETDALVADAKALPAHGGPAPDGLQPEPANPADIPALVVMTMHAGSWRGASNEYEAMVFTHDDGKLTLHFPLMASPHPRAHLHSGEHDPELPLSYRRRLWALIAGPMQNHTQLYRFRETEAYITLDQYKDWILDWEQDDTVSYPRLVFDRHTVEKWKDRLEEHPAGEELARFIEFNDTEQRRTQLWKRLTGGSYASSPLAHFRWALAGGGADSWTAGMRQAQYASWAHYVDELLSSPELPVEQRHLLRQHVAAICHFFAEPDVIPRGSLVRMHNPNMHINRSFPLVYAAALIPDHPKASEWLEASADAYVRYQAIRNISPSGGWSELISYFGAGAPTLMHAAMVMQNAGYLDDETAELVASAGLHILQQLTPPDPRFGCRIAPGWGHEGIYLDNHWTTAAGLVRHNPQLAKALIWGWDQQNRPGGAHHDDGFSPRAIIHADLLNDIEPGYIPPQVKSTWMPGFGAVLRAHTGDPDETYMSYRAAYQLRGCASQNDFVIYAKGAPLVPISTRGYAAHSEEIGELYRNFGWHNRLRFGSRDNWEGWPSGGIAAQVHAHSFSDSVDYIRAHGDYSTRTAQYWRDLVDYLAEDDHEYQRWTRQILFLKGKSSASPNYFIFRESVHSLSGDDAILQPKWWSLRTLGPKELVETDDTGFRYFGPYGAGIDVRFLEPASVQLESRDATTAFSLQFDALRNWREANPDAPMQETITVNSAGAFEPDQNLLVVLYPFGEDEPLPQYTALAEGVAKITTNESEDYVFVSRTTLEYAEGDIAFSGRAGAIRVYPGEVHLVIAEGPGEVTYRGATLKSAEPAVRVLPAQPWQEQVIELRGTFFRLIPEENGGLLDEVQPGVQKFTLADGFGFAFNSEEQLDFNEDGVTFTGKVGGVEVNEKENTVRVVIMDGERAGFGDLQVWSIEGQAGPCVLLFEHDRVTGKTYGQGRFLYVSAPPGLNQLPELRIDSRSYAPGTSWGFIPPTIWDPSYYIPDPPFDRRLNDMTIIMPVLPGVREVELRNQQQPPVFRNWQRW